MYYPILKLKSGVYANTPTQKIIIEVKQRKFRLRTILVHIAALLHCTTKIKRFPKHTHTQKN